MRPRRRPCPRAAWAHGAALFSCYLSTGHVQPSLDETMGNLAQLFGQRNEEKGRYDLEVLFSTQEAYG